jgi:spore maturation protein CgeB
MKIFLVSDTASFALTDVYYGYLNSFQKKGIETVGYPFHHFVTHHRESICLSMIHSQALLRSNGFTHILFIGGLNIPPEYLESFPGIKVGIISTEDPHSFDPLKDRLDKLDYYFTNESAVVSSGLFPNAHYCPTAADPSTCGAVPRHSLDLQYLTDILFLGAVYPNRRKMLEGIIPWVKENNLSMKILGHPQYVPKSSPIWEFVPKENYNSRTGAVRTIPHEETIKYYNGAKVSLNFFRDVSWSPSGENTLNSLGLIPESMNPRAYEIPLCGGFQLLEDTRKEAREFFTESQVGFFSDTRGLKRQLKRFLLAPGATELREKMSRDAAFQVVTKGTYMERVNRILKIIS